MSEALSAGEVRRRGAAGGWRGAGGASGVGGSPWPLSGSLWARRGGRLSAWSAPWAGGWAGGAGWSRGRAGSGSSGHLLWSGARPQGANPAWPRRTGAAGGSEGSARPAAPGSPASARASRDPLLPGPSAPGALPLCTGRPDG